MIEFPVSGVETFWWLPALVAFLISAFASTSGISGAFLLLPFQVSILGFTSLAVSPTNLVYNVIAIPGGIYRFIHEKRMLWPLAIIIIAGTMPGLIVGAYLRTTLLASPEDFKLFVGVVLAFILIRLVIEIFKNKKESKRWKKDQSDFQTKTISFTVYKLKYEFNGEIYAISTILVFVLASGVGIISGTYGIGGGAIIAPFLVAVFGLPVYTVAGPALLSTFFTSIAGIFVYSYLLPVINPAQAAIYPDWQLGFSFGIGGLAGIYLGARIQRYLPAWLIKIFLVIALAIVVIKYITGYFEV